MSDPSLPTSHETSGELAADSGIAGVERRTRRTQWMSHAAAALCLALVFAVGTSSAQADSVTETMPAPAEDGPADPALVQDLEARLAVLLEDARADLDARVEAKADAIVQQAAEEQGVALLQQAEQKLAASREIAKRDDGRLAKLSD